MGREPTITLWPRPRPMARNTRPRGLCGGRADALPPAAARLLLTFTPPPPAPPALPPAPPVELWLLLRVAPVLPLLGVLIGTDTDELP